MAEFGTRQLPRVGADYFTGMQSSSRLGAEIHGQSSQPFAHRSNLHKHTRTIWGQIEAVKYRVLLYSI